MAIGKYEIHGLYIKLDKKLILKSDKIILPEKKEKASFKSIDKGFSRIKNIFTFFDYIELSEVNFKNNKFRFIYTKNILYLHGNDYEIAGNIRRVGKTLVADVSLFNIEKYNVSIRGKFKYFLDKDRLETEGSFDASNISGNFAAFKADNKISFAINSGEFNELKTLTDMLPLKDKLKQWIAYNVEGEKYLLHSFIGKAKIDKSGLKIDFGSLRGNATLKNVLIKYNKNLKPVHAKELAITYKNSALYFDLKEPRYKGRNLDGSKVSILNIGKGKKPILHVDLHVKSAIDKVVHNILKEYKLNIPFELHNAKAIADINLTIPLVKKHKTDVVVDIDLPKGTVYANKVVKLAVQSGNVHYKTGIVTLKNIVLKDKAYAGNVNGKVYIKRKKADLDFKIKRVQLSDKKQTYFEIKNRDVKIKFDYAKHILDIPTLNIRLIRSDKEFIVKLLNLNTLNPYIKKIPITVDGGKLDISTKDFKKYKFSGTLKRNACFFYDNDVCHTIIKCNGEVSEKSFIFSAFNKRLYIDMSKSSVDVNNLNIDIKALFTEMGKKENKKNRKISKSFVIRGKNSKVRYENHTLLTDNYKINVSANGDIKAVGNLGKDKVEFNKKGDSVYIEAIRIKDKLLHPLIDFDGLKRGSYTFKSRGDPNKTMYGEVLIEGGVMSGFKAYNNTLALLNTLPALATFSKPGYSDEGFHIKKGIAKYRKIGDKIYFDSIHIEGDSADIVGKGMIDLENNTINMKMAILTARELGKVVGSIPVVGYILMGEDKSMTVGLKIEGSLSKPIVETSAAKELLSLPFDIIKRTFKVEKKTIRRDKEVIEKIIDSNRTKIFNRLAP
ncbi:Putative periplasmic protein [hydrothermal vent metagenome]|uniref:Putative periplasmic protein n=1 Tax=hydrothermal vent metagenome TaxID=652676 RepID=A0A1W1ECU8_9ZZZZ